MRRLALLGFLILLAVPAAAAPPISGDINVTAHLSEHYSRGILPLSIDSWLYRLTSVRAQDKPFGTMTLACIRVSQSSSLRQCAGTVSLPRGKVMMGGTLIYTDVYELAVTGGTRLYRGAVGVVTVIQIGSGKTSSVKVRLGT